MFFMVLSLEALFCDAGHSLHSSAVLVEMICPLQIIKELSILDNNFVIETVLEECMQTVQMLVVETDCIQFL